ncbi:MAG: deoxyguanosinetriphosphate triphosphohydrolase [Mariprofundaceae bacterium]
MSLVYEASLAPYAMLSSLSRGRLQVEQESPGRNPFQRDRDRVIHSTAFRRLEYKTQVFVNHEGDHYRTRLTHSIEVAQIARSICRTMHLQEDLAEAVALAHDLGHTPFGHSGQDSLDAVMKDYGGFEHNRQSLRIVETLEHRYADFLGLNLSYETREGIVKHHSPHDTPKNADLAEYFLNEQATLEVQVANLADEIAYNNHDIDDGIRAGMLTIEQLQQAELFRMFYQEVIVIYEHVDERMLVAETIRRMIDFLIRDVVDESHRRLQEGNISSLADVRAAKHALIGFSKKTRQMTAQLKRLLYKNMYKHYRVVRMAAKANRVIRELFEAYMDCPDMLPDSSRRLIIEGMNESKQARVIADYIAGMTDRYALEEYRRLFDVHARS